MSAHSQYELVMGLETHVRVASDTKMFCSCKNARELAEEPNMYVCDFCMGFPGTLPVLNESVIRLAIRASLAMRSDVQLTSIFDRKSYFYPDLPAGFQITQLYHPIALHGEVRAMVSGEAKAFRIHRMHIETDAGKLVHAGSKTLCDYNRSGSPLMEIVTEPDFRTKEDVLAYLEELQKLMRWCSASEADMDKGQLRCDVNISLRKWGETILNNRVELKNLNSFSAIWRAIDNEFARQAKIYESGGTVTQETRWWDDEKGISSPQRSKEDAMDYRYFPEPDLPPLRVSQAQIDEQAAFVTELPMDRRERYSSVYQLQEDDARILSNDRVLSDYYEDLVRLTNDPKKSCSYITSVLFALMDGSETARKISDLPFAVSELAEVIRLANADELSSTNAKVVIETLFRNGGTASAVIDSKWLRQTNDTAALEAIVEQVLADSAAQIAEYRSGKTNLFGFFVWQCMKRSAWQGNPKIFTDLLQKKLAYDS